MLLTFFVEIVDFFKHRTYSTNPQNIYMQELYAFAILRIFDGVCLISELNILPKSNIKVKYFDSMRYGNTFANIVYLLANIGNCYTRFVNHKMRIDLIMQQTYCPTHIL